MQRQLRAWSGDRLAAGGPAGYRPFSRSTPYAIPRTPSGAKAYYPISVQQDRLELGPVVTNSGMTSYLSSIVVGTDYIVFPGAEPWGMAYNTFPEATEYKYSGFNRGCEQGTSDGTRFYFATRAHTIGMISVSETDMATINTTLSLDPAPIQLAVTGTYLFCLFDANKRRLIRYNKSTLESSATFTLPAGAGEIRTFFTDGIHVYVVTNAPFTIYKYTHSSSSVLASATYFEEFNYVNPSIATTETHFYLAQGSRFLKINKNTLEIEGKAELEGETILAIYPREDGYVNVLCNYIGSASPFKSILLAPVASYQISHYAKGDS